MALNDAASTIAAKKWEEEMKAAGNPTIGSL